MVKLMANSFRARREHLVLNPLELKMARGKALTVLHVPYSLDRGLPSARLRDAHECVSREAERVCHSLSAQRECCSLVDERFPHHSTLNLKLQTLNTKHQTPYTKHQTPNPQHQTLNTKHQTPNTNPQHQTPNTKTPKTKPSTQTGRFAAMNFLLHRIDWACLETPRQNFTAWSESAWLKNYHLLRFSTWRETPNPKHQTQTGRFAAMNFLVHSIINQGKPSTTLGVD